MTLQRIPALAILAVSAASPLHAQRETDKRPPHGDHPGSQLLDESFGNLEKAISQARRVATEAIRQRDIALRALEGEKRTSEALRKRVEERMKHPEVDRRPGANAAPHDRQDAARRDVRPPVADFREEMAAARKELSALREELGKLHGNQHPKDDASEHRKRIAQLEGEKRRLEEMSKVLAGKLEAEMEMRKALEEKLAASAATGRKSEAMEQLFKEREEELKKLRQELEKFRHQNRDRKRVE